ncbi:MAG: GNAT family N-acetyltransferase [Planctomycetaceae bacterium]|nr:GNAT family N-acetyltransferase [Planctomycetaceae bacterium]
MRIVRLSSIVSADLSDLLLESQTQGFGFVQRLVLEWELGTNRFECAGEALFAAQQDGVTVGVCGLNIDPYANDPSLGRVRHLYVLASLRRRGIGRALVEHVIATAKQTFNTLRLRTKSPTAAAFYEALGFEPCPDDAACTHCMLLDHRETLPKN